MKDELKSMSSRVDKLDSRQQKKKWAVPTAIARPAAGRSLSLRDVTQRATLPRAAQRFADVATSDATKSRRIRADAQSCTHADKVLAADYTVIYDRD